MEALETERAASRRWLRPLPGSRPRRIACLAAATVVLLAGWYLADRYWPYRYRNVKPLLDSVLASQITVSQYHRTYFPHPGFVAKGLVLRRNSAQDLAPVGTADDLIVRGSWIDLLLLRDRVELVDVVGLHVVIPPVGSEANRRDFPEGSSADFAGPTAVVAEFHLHRAQLDIQRTNGGTYSFPIRDLVIRNLQRGQTIDYSVDMQNAIPSGHILSHGTFGPLNPANLGGTPLSGDFTFTEIDLSEIGALHGRLDASDHFSGTIASIRANATASTPNFAVDDGRPTALSATIDCTVNALNGDIALNRIEAKTGTSTISAQGSIAGAPKTTNLDLTVANGRVQDLMRPFVSGPVPVAGAVSMRGHAVLLPAANGAGFLQRLRVQGNFQAPAEQLTDRPTERSLSSFSQRAVSNKPAEPADAATDVLSSIGGSVQIGNGIVSTQNLSLAVPGAVAHLGGTYNLNNTSAHMTGHLVMDQDISHVTTGFKSLLLKPLAPFFRKPPAGAVIPIAVTGTSGNYKVSQDVMGKK
jgi:hypothetical protein